MTPSTNQNQPNTERLVRHDSAEHVHTMPSARQRQESSMKRKHWDLSVIKSEDKPTEEAESVQLIEAFLH